MRTLSPTRRPPNRTTADPSAYPDLVVIYLGMRVNSPKGVKALTSFGAKIRKSVEAKPDGLACLHQKPAAGRSPLCASVNRGVAG